MNKVRIVERTAKDGKISYVVQRKILLWWFDAEATTGIQEARDKLCYYDGTKEKDKVVDLVQRKSDPETAAIREKLKEMFREKRSSLRLCKKDFGEWLSSLAPKVKEEHEENLPEAVSEANGKVFVVRSPVQGNRFLVIDEDLAMAALTLGELPSGGSWGNLENDK